MRKSTCGIVLPTFRITANPRTGARTPTLAGFFENPTFVPPPMAQWQDGRLFEKCCTTGEDRIDMRRRHVVTPLRVANLLSMDSPSKVLEQQQQLIRVHRTLFKLKV